MLRYAQHDMVLGHFKNSASLIDFQRVWERGVSPLLRPESLSEDL